MFYFSTGFERHAEVAEIDCFCDKTLGDLRWLDELSTPPKI
jgi:hypothetical protein